MRLNAKRRVAGFSIVEVVIAAMLVLMTAIGSTHALLMANRMSGANRVLTAARTVVQRNIDAAMTIRFDSTITPAILATTTSTGATYDDDGGSDSKVNILTIKDSSGNLLPMIKGTLQRTVVPVTNAQNAVIRQVTFRLTYTYERRPYTVEMTTIRSIDD